MKKRYEFVLTHQQRGRGRGEPFPYIKIPTSVRDSQYEKLKEIAQWDNGKGKMHHKVFIIDEKVVITGSMNPSKSGNENNDENVIIIEDEKIAKKYVDEFENILT